MPKIDKAIDMLEEYSEILVQADERIAQLERRLKHGVHNDQLSRSLAAAKKRKLLAHKFLKNQLLSQFGSVEVPGFKAGSVIEQSIAVAKYLREMKHEHQKLAEELKLEELDVSTEMKELKNALADEAAIMHRSYKVEKAPDDAELMAGRPGNLCRIGSAGSRGDGRGFEWRERDSTSILHGAVCGGEACRRRLIEGAGSVHQRNNEKGEAEALSLKSVSQTRRATTLYFLRKQTSHSLSVFCSFPLSRTSSNLRSRSSSLIDIRARATEASFPTSLQQSPSGLQASLSVTSNTSPLQARQLFGRFWPLCRTRWAQGSSGRGFFRSFLRKPRTTWPRSRARSEMSTQWREAPRSMIVIYYVKRGTAQGVAGAGLDSPLPGQEQGKHQARRARRPASRAQARLRCLQATGQPLPPTSQEYMQGSPPHPAVKEKNDERVFYYPLETPFLDDPEKQRTYRDKIRKMASELPSAPRLHLYADILHKKRLEMLEDHSAPAVALQDIKTFYRRRLSTLQHRKYKTIQRWGRFGHRSPEFVDIIGLKAGYVMGKIQMELDNSLERVSRLSNDDDYEESFKNVRPQPRPPPGVSEDTRHAPKNKDLAKESDDLYEKFEFKEHHSLLRQDDIEVYLRLTTFQNKVTRPVMKIANILKTLPLSHRFEIFKRARKEMQLFRNQRVEEQHALEEETLARMQDAYLAQLGTCTAHMQSSYISEVFKRALHRWTLSKEEREIQTDFERGQLSFQLDYDYAPALIDNVCELKVKLLKLAAAYGLYGNVDLDNGYSFAYLVTLFFPNGLQDALTRTDFKQYDAYATEVDYKVIGHRHLPKVATLIKHNEEQKRILEKKDKKPAAADDTEAMADTQQSFASAKLGGHAQVQLKTTQQDGPQKAFVEASFIKKATWLNFISFRPRIPDFQKIQDVKFGLENQLDSLLKNSFFALHITSIAEVNKILEEAALSHKNRVYNRMKMRQELERAAWERAEESHFHTALKTSKPGGAVMKRIESSEHISSRARPSPRNTTRVSGKSQQLRISQLVFTPQQTEQLFVNIPAHLLKSLYSLRHINTLEHRVRLLQALNFFRAIQKRLAIDALETYSRQRIQGHATVIPPVESIQERQGKPAEEAVGVESVVKTPASEFENDSVVDLKCYRYNQQFVNRFTSTNPVIPLLHAPFSSVVSVDPQLEQNRPLPRVDNSISMMTSGVLEKEFKTFRNRADNLQLLQTPLGSEACVRDQFGVRIVYDAALDDLDMMEEHLLRIGSYYIRQHEHLLDSETHPAFPALDRTQLVNDLFKWEAEFQSAKMELVFAWLEVYEHVCDLVEQNRLIQLLTDLMARRPRFNLQAGYFRTSYELEIRCLEKETEMMKRVTRYQMESERKEMNDLKGFLQTKYQKVKEHMDQHWNYYRVHRMDDSASVSHQDAQSSVAPSMSRQPTATNPTASQHPASISHQPTTTVRPPPSQTPDTMAAAGLPGSDEMEGSEAGGEQGVDRHSSLFMRKDLNFARVLGLPRITLQKAFEDFKLEGDQTVLDKLHEQANFIKLEQGYPVLFNGNTHSPTLVVNLTPGVKDQLRPITMLDFYESLVSLTRIQIALNHASQELRAAFPPEHTVAEMCMELAMYDEALDFISQIKSETSSYVDGAYYCRNLEDGLIVDKPDKLAFALKEAHVEIEDRKIPKNPYLIGRMDLEMIQGFNFPARREAEIMFGAPQLNRSEVFFERMLAQQFSLNPGLLKFQTHSDLLQSQKEPWPYQAPPIMHSFCNIIEVLRLRQNMIRLVVETQQMEQIYTKQLDALKAEKKQRPMNADPLQFGDLLNDANYVDGGPATGEWKSAGMAKSKRIAAVQFDQTAISLIDFGSIDCVKALSLTSGVEELRAVTHYQISHLHALTVAVLFNQKLMDGFQKAQAEVELLENYNLVSGEREPILLSPLASYLPSQQAQHLFEFGVDRGHKDALINYIQGANNKVIAKIQNSVIYVNNFKYPHRASILKKYFSLVSKYVPLKRKIQIRQRLQRILRMRLMHQFCELMNRDTYMVAIKLQTAKQMEELKVAAFKLPPVYQCFASQSLDNVDSVLSEYQRAFFNEMTQENVAAQATGTLRTEGSVESLKSVSITGLSLMRPIFLNATPFNESPKTQRRMGGLGAGGLGGGTFGINFSSQGAAKTMKPKVLGYAIENILYLPTMEEISNFDKHLGEEALLKLNSELEKRFGSYTSHTELSSLSQEIYPESGLKAHFTRGEDHPLRAYRQRLYDYKNGKLIPSLRSADFLGAYEYPDAVYYPLVLISTIRRIFELETFIQLFASTVTEICELHADVKGKKVVWPDQEFMKPPPPIDSLFAQKARFAPGDIAHKPIEQAVREAYPYVAERVIKWAFERKKLKADLQDDLRFVSQRMDALKAIVDKILSRQKPAPEPPAEGTVSPVKPIKTQEAINRYENNEQALEYLTLYYEYRFMTLELAVERMQDHYYKVRSEAGVVETADMLTQLTGRDQWQVTLDNSFRVKGFTRSDLYTQGCGGALETNALLGLTEHDHRGYLKCVRPLIDEHAMITPQLGVFETSLESYHQRKVLGSVGEEALSCKLPDGMPSTLGGPLVWGMALLPQGDRQYFLSELKAIESGITNTLEAYGEPKHGTAGLVTSVESLQYGRALLGAQIQSRQLKWFVMQWISERGAIPLDPEAYIELQNRYKELIFWKEMKLKDAQSQRTKFLREERMKKNREEEKSKVAKRQDDALVEAIASMKVQSQVCTQELERQLLMQGIEALKREHSGLMGALEMSARELEIKIHPHQQFATTLFPFLDRNGHLDLINKVVPIQSFLSRLRNRCTEINTLTTGPGIVFSLKDFNECIFLLARQLLKWGELELKSRVETGALQTRFLQHLAYCRTQERDLVSQKLQHIEKEIDKIVNARLSESSAHLIYELDTVSRELRLMKDSVYTMEARVRFEVQQEYDHEMQSAAQQLQISTERFKDFREDLMQNLKGEIVANKNQILQMILNIFMKYKGEPADIRGAPRRLAQDPSRSVLSTQQSDRESSQQGMSLATRRLEAIQAARSQASSRGGVVRQSGFSKSKLGGGQIYVEPREASGELQDQVGSIAMGSVMGSVRGKSQLEVAIEEDKIMDATQAKEEIVELTARMRQMRFFYKFKEVTQREKFLKELHKMRLQMTSNSALWEELSQAQRRQQIVSQELLYTQQSLAACEKIIENLGGQIYDLSNQKLRLERYRENKGKRLEELEGRIKHLVVMEQVNSHKLIKELKERQKTLSELRAKEAAAEERIALVRIAEQRKVRDMARKYEVEKKVKENAIKRIDMMRAELLALETVQEDGENIEGRNEWKRKCIELFEIATSLQDEVDTLKQANAQSQQQARALQEQLQRRSEIEDQAAPVPLARRNYSERAQSIQLSKNILKPSMSVSPVKAKRIQAVRPSIESTSAGSKLANLLGLAPTSSTVSPKHDRSQSMMTAANNSSFEIRPTQVLMKPSPLGYHPSNDSLVSGSLQSPSTADLDTNRHTLGVATNITPHGPPSLFSHGKFQSPGAGTTGGGATSRTQPGRPQPLTVKLAGQMIISQASERGLAQKGSLSTIVSGAHIDPLSPKR